MIRHVNGPTCDSCTEKIQSCHPRLREWVVELKKKHNNVHVSCGFRNKTDQDRAYLDKKSQLRWPNSKHNNTVNGLPCSLAVDLFQLDSKGIAVWNPLFFTHLDQQNQMKDEMRWGGLFKSLGDYCHFELKNPKG